MIKLIGNADLAEQGISEQLCEVLFILVSKSTLFVFEPITVINVENSLSVLLSLSSVQHNSSDL